MTPDTSGGTTIRITCWGHCTSQWWPAQTRPWSWERKPQRSHIPGQQSPRSHHGTAWSGTAQRRGDVTRHLWLLNDKKIKWRIFTHQLVICDLRTGDIVHEPPSSASNSGGTDVSCLKKKKKKINVLGRKCIHCTLFILLVNKIKVYVFLYVFIYSYLCFYSSLGRTGPNFEIQKYMNKCL